MWEAGASSFAERSNFTSGSRTTPYLRHHVEQRREMRAVGSYSALVMLMTSTALLTTMSSHRGPMWTVMPAPLQQLAGQTTATLHAMLSQHQRVLLNIDHELRTFQHTDFRRSKRIRLHGQWSADEFQALF